MKRILACSIAAAISVSVVPGAFAQSRGMGGMDMKSDKANAKTHKASGTVAKVDGAKSTVTIAHGPVPSMSWPAMTMAFKVKDRKMLEKLKPGDKVDFSFVQSGKDYAITQVR